jgi:hypothetical protein
MMVLQFGLGAGAFGVFTILTELPLQPATRFVQQCGSFVQGQVVVNHCTGL